MGVFQAEVHEANGSLSFGVCFPADTQDVSQLAYRRLCNFWRGARMEYFQVLCTVAPQNYYSYVMVVVFAWALRRQHDQLPIAQMDPEEVCRTPNYFQARWACHYGVCNSTCALGGFPVCPQQR